MKFYAHTYCFTTNRKSKFSTLKKWTGKSMNDIINQAFSHYKTLNFHIEQITKKQYENRTIHDQITGC